MKTNCQGARPRNLFVLSLLALMANASAVERVAVAGSEPAPVVHVDPQTQLRFPAKLSELRYRRVREFNDKRLGYCVVYEGDTSLGQVCVYDFGHDNLPTGVDSKEFQAALKLAVDGTLEGFNHSPFRNGQLIATGTPSIQHEGKEAKAEMRMFTSEHGAQGETPVQNVDMVLMTTGLGKFLKFNYTAKNTKPDAFAEQTRAVIQEFVAFNEPTMGKLLVGTRKSTVAEKDTGLKDEGRVPATQPPISSL